MKSDITLNGMGCKSIGKKIKIIIEKDKQRYNKDLILIRLNFD
jgi:hypothetical protein